MTGGADGAVAATGEAPPTVEDGRYVYCLVALDARDGRDGSDDGTALAVTGVDGADPYLLSVDGVGAVVHDCEGLYEDDDPEVVKRWLVAHQSVVDAAAERFGTPLPFRFDTVLEGGDDAVREWVGEHSGAVRDALADLAGCWEYRITLEWAEDAEEHLLASDEGLRQLHERRASAPEGRAYLVDKQYEERLRAARSERAADLESRLADTVDPVVRERATRDGAPALAEGDRDPVTRLAVLADREDESALGDRLDDVAAEPDVVVRFSGPWPPYTFAPELP